MLFALNQNKVLWGVSMLLLNLGSRYVIADLGKSHDYILSSHIVKKIVVLAMFFVATRDLLTSFLLTISYILIVDGILHDKRPYNLLPKKVLDEVKNKGISNEDYMRAKNLMSMYEKQHQSRQSNDDDDGNDTKTTDGENKKEHNEAHTVEKKKEYINYLTNIAILKASNH